jgi:hypothetical protein
LLAVWLVWALILATRQTQFLYIQNNDYLTFAMAGPVIFIMLARLGRSPAFDRSWVFASTLLSGLEATLFTFDVRVA